MLPLLGATQPSSSLLLGGLAHGVRCDSLLLSAKLCMLTALGRRGRDARSGRAGRGGCGLIGQRLVEYLGLDAQWLGR